VKAAVSRKFLGLGRGFAGFVLLVAGPVGSLAAQEPQFHGTKSPRGCDTSVFPGGAC
jgi:hypothetical protein